MPTSKPEDNDSNKESKLTPVEKPNRRARTQKEETVKVDIASIPNIDNAEQIEANKIASDANDISKKSKNVNAALLVITIVLAFISMCQYKSSSDAVIVAQNSLDSSAKYNRKTLEIQIAANKSADSTEIEKFKRDTASFNLQKQSVDAQIKALKETQNQFIVANDPALQAINFMLNFSSKGTPEVKYDLTNLGKQYVNIVNYRIGLATSERILNNTEIDSLIDNKMVRYGRSKIILGNIPQSMFALDSTITVFKTTPYGKRFITAIGEIIYINPIGNKHKKYRFAAKINSVGGVNYEMIYNRNYFEK